MKIFLAGATGAIGKRLVPLLISSGHHVVGMTRSSAKVDQLRAAGVEPAVADALDRAAVMAAVMSARPDVVVHQLTAIANVRNLKKIDEEFALTNRLRTEGTQYLLAAAQAAGARKFIAQSYTGWPNTRTGGRVKNEEDPLDPNPPKEIRRTIEAIGKLENMVSTVTGLSGTVLRYGSFYGPGTSLGEGGYIIDLIRRRNFPMFGEGTGVWSFLHIDDAANATKLAIERESSGIFNIVDDEPVETSRWLPDLAQALGAKPPRRLPVWLGRMLIGDIGIAMMNSVRGSSNAKAKRVLGWQPAFANSHDGFRDGLSDAGATRLQVKQSA